MIQEEKIDAKFNEAFFISRRLDWLQSEIYKIKPNLLAYNYEYGVYNYQVFFTHITSLLAEVYNKLTKTEKQEADGLFEQLFNFSKKCPVHKKVKDQFGSEKDILNNSNWEIYEKNLLLFSLKVKQYLDSHNMGNPNKDDLRGL